MSAIKKSSYVCYTCQSSDIPVFSHYDEYGDEPQYYFYQIKSFSTIKYKTDYAFCSKECMDKYLKRRKEATFLQEKEQPKYTEKLERILTEAMIPPNYKEWTINNIMAVIQEANLDRRKKEL